MTAVCAGDIDQLGVLFERYHQRLYRYLFQLTNDANISEDIVQTVFYRILKYKHTYRSDGKFVAWMYHIARSILADNYRKKTLSTNTFDVDMLEEHPSLDPSPDMMTCNADDINMLRQALQNLPLEEREIIHLARFENLGHSEIAQILDCSVGAAKVRLCRALQQLRDVYFKLEMKRENSF